LKKCPPNPGGLPPPLVSPVFPPVKSISEPHLKWPNRFAETPIFFPGNKGFYNKGGREELKRKKGKGPT